MDAVRGGGGCHKRLWNERNGLRESVLVSDARKISPVYITIKVSSLNSTKCSSQSTVESFFTLSVFQLDSNSAAHTEPRNGVPAVALGRRGEDGSGRQEGASATMLLR
jgi:hypothetical protein